MSELPDVVAIYQDAHDRGDVETALAAFAPNASVVDRAVTLRRSNATVRRPRAN
jgi:hypothetical protein